MKYMLLIYGDEQAAAQASPEQMKQVSDAYDEFTQSIIKSGNFLDGDPFLPGEKLHKLADILQADSPEHAIEMAGRIPGARWGSVEVRPVMEFE